MRSPSSSVSTDKIRGMRPRPDRIDRLPQQYFAGLLARVAAAAALEGEPLVDLGRGNPDIGPPAHVVERLYAVAPRTRRRSSTGTRPSSGCPS